MSLVMLWMVIMGAGSGFFFSPNTNAIMGAVATERRGIAAGTRTMMNNAGMMISMALGLALVSSSMNPQALNALIIGTQVGAKGVAVGEFISGLHHTFMISFAISLEATAVALMRGPHQGRVTKASSEALSCSASK
jgi:MFS family permease